MAFLAGRGLRLKECEGPVRRLEDNYVTHLFHLLFTIAYVEIVQ